MFEQELEQIKNLTVDENLAPETLVSGAGMNLAGTLKLAVCFPVNFLFFLSGSSSLGSHSIICRSSVNKVIEGYATVLEPCQCSPDIVLWSDYKHQSLFTQAEELHSLFLPLLTL